MYIVKKKTIYKKLLSIGFRDARLDDYDYIDVKVPVLKAMYGKRALESKLLGDMSNDQKGIASEQMRLF